MQYDLISHYYRLKTKTVLPLFNQIFTEGANNFGVMLCDSVVISLTQREFKLTNK